MSDPSSTSSGTSSGLPSVPPGAKVVASDAPDPAAAGPDAASLADDGDRPSVTDAGGSIARFDMSYSPQHVERTRFGAPMRELVPSFIYLAVVLGLVVAIAIGYSSAPGSQLFALTVKADRGRPFPASVLAILLTSSAAATVLRATMRGVIVDEAGLEVRTILLLGFPRLKRWAWAQVHRIVVDEKRILIELWDGQHEFLPRVAEHEKLAETLGSIATRRRITITHLAPKR